MTVAMDILNENTDACPKLITSRFETDKMLLRCMFPDFFLKHIIIYLFVLQARKSNTSIM